MAREDKRSIYCKDKIWEPPKAKYAGLGMSKLVQILLAKLNKGEIKLEIEDLKQ